MTSSCSGLPASEAAKWMAYPDGWRDTRHNGTYMPSQVLSIHDGMLDIYLHHSASGTPLVAAVEPKVPSDGGPGYGAYIVRFRADPVAGYKTSWMLWPDDDRAWPEAGEIDFPEGDLNGLMLAFLHREGATSPNDQYAFATSARYSSWHTAVIEWTQSDVRLILDGQLIGSATSRIPDQPMHWVLQTETSTDGAVPSRTASAHVLVDWVAVYQPTS